MDEFIKKLIARLEEEHEKLIDDFNRKSLKGSDIAYEDGMSEGFGTAIDSIIKFTEEHKSMELAKQEGKQ